MDIKEVIKEKASDVSEFFQKLGYETTWDFNSSGKWWEILTKDHTTFLQIDMGVPVSAIIQDFRCFNKGKDHGDSDYDYQVNVRPGYEKEFKKLLKKVVAVGL